MNLLDCERLFKIIVTLTKFEIRKESEKHQHEIVKEAIVYSNYKEEKIKLNFSSMVNMFKSEEVRNWREIAKIETENKNGKCAGPRTRNSFWTFTKGGTGRFANTALLP